MTATRLDPYGEYPDMKPVDLAEAARCYRRALNTKPVQTGECHACDARAREKWRAALDAAEHLLRISAIEPEAAGQSDAEFIEDAYQAGALLPPPGPRKNYVQRAEPGPVVGPEELLPDTQQLTYREPGEVEE